MNISTKLYRFPPIRQDSLTGRKSCESKGGVVSPMNILLRLRGQADKNRICKVYNHSLSSTNNKDYKWLKHKVTIKMFRDVDKHACHMTPSKNGDH